MGTKLRIKEGVFYSKKFSFHPPFDLSVTQSILTTNEQVVKTRLPTFTRKQILLKTVKNWLKYSVHMGKAWRKTSESLGKARHNYVSFRFLVTTLFKLVTSFWKKVGDFYEQSSRRVSWAVGAYWNRCCGEQTHFSALVSLAKKIVYFIFNLLTKTSEPHKGRLLVVVSFFVYFRRVSSLTETSSGNEYN